MNPTHSKIPAGVHPDRGIRKTHVANRVEKRFRQATRAGLVIVRKHRVQMFTCFGLPST